ncbi:putative FBD-associated F-box protein At5g56690 [Solanum dulcamara]|uniref:putative FBD-associated F-box protein At5g56690 n=1 Tax=Solanum dulcamara TaxID=45834 RepID=UPI002486626A|nr:putative FBD-associated F-box protein At5g56690 [Solanum dulcamara]
MVDILSDCLIQKILSFLSYQEVTRMSILSKTWLRAWFDHPNLDFTINCLGGNTNRVNTIMERYRKGKIPIEKFELSEFFVNSHVVFPLIDKWLDIALQNGVKDLSLYFTSYPVPIVTILAAKSVRELVLQGSNLMPVSLSSSVVICNSLRKLSLSHVRLDENILQTLLNSCPLIVSFILEYCSGNLRKIKSDSMKVLKIHHHRGIGEIDTPNLVSLDYMGNQIPELKIARESSQLEHSEIFLECINNLNAAWFYKLRKFLSNLSSWSQVSLYFSGEINMTDLQMDHIGSTPQVDILNVNILWMNQTIECPTFVEALLWSCHPRRLNLFSNIIGTIANFMDRLMFMKNSSHSTSHSNTPWHSQLKEIKYFDGKNQSLQLRSGEHAKRTNIDGEEKVYLLLDW